MLFKPDKQPKPDLVITIHLCAIHKDFCKSQSKKMKGKTSSVMVEALFSQSISHCPSCKVEYES